MKKSFLMCFLLSLIYSFMGCSDPVQTGGTTPPSNSEYTVTYKGNDNLSGDVPVDSNSYISGNMITVLDNTGNLTRTNYTFDGWNTQADGLGLTYAAGETFTATRNVTLYAKWETVSVFPTRTFRALERINNTFYDCETELLAEGHHCLIYVEKTSTVSQQTAEEIAGEFDNNIYDPIRDNFGTESDVDSNGKIILLFLDILDGYSGSGGYIAGFFHMINDFSISTYAESNEADMIFLDTYPSVAGSESSYGTIAHEFQHLINFNTTYIVDNDQETQNTWVNEGLSSAAEYVYSGEINQSRVDYYNADPNDAILYGDNFFVWNGYWENQGYTLENYATVNLFFQWLRIHASNGTGIYKEILLSDFMDYRAVTSAASTRISSVFGNWEDLLSTWMFANLVGSTSGFMGYSGEIEAVAKFFSSSDNYEFSFSPGERIFSRMPDSGSATPPASGANIRYIGISDQGILDKTAPYTGVVSLVFNANTDCGGPNESGYVASYGNEAILPSFQRSISSNISLPESYIIDLQFNPDGSVVEQKKTTQISPRKIIKK